MRALVLCIAIVAPLLSCGGAVETDDQGAGGASASSATTSTVVTGGSGGAGGRSDAGTSGGAAPCSVECSAGEKWCAYDVTGLPAGQCVACVCVLNP